MHVKFDAKSLEVKLQSKMKVVQIYRLLKILQNLIIDTEHQWANVFTKPLTAERFDFIKKNLNMHFVSD